MTPTLGRTQIIAHSESGYGPGVRATVTDQDRLKGLPSTVLRPPASSPRNLSLLVIPTSSYDLHQLVSPCMTIHRSARRSGSHGRRKSRPTSFVLPDLVSHCDFPLQYHPNGDEIARQSVAWLDKNCPELSPKRRAALFGLRAGELTAFCYNTAPADRLRVVSDWMNYLFHLDDISDGMMTRETDSLADAVMNALWFPEWYRPTASPGRTQPCEEINAGKLARDFWKRCLPGAGPGTQARFKETVEFFFESVNIQAKARDANIVPDLESYIDVRRDTSGCKPCWVLIEYGLGIDLPDFVVEDPVIMALNQYTNDLVTWSNDIFSYNKEQAAGDTHNMITILMMYHNHTLQSAVDYVGQLCKETIDAFNEDRKKIPSWGPEIDDMVQRYLKGLQDWIVGSLHWSFITTRYFGKEGAVVKKRRIVKLSPPKIRSAA